MATMHNGRELLGEKLKQVKKKQFAEKTGDTAHAAGGCLTSLLVTLLLYAVFFLLREPIGQMSEGLLDWLNSIELPLLMEIILWIPKLFLGAVFALWPFAVPALVGMWVYGNFIDKEEARQGSRKHYRKELEKREGVLEGGVSGEEYGEQILMRLEPCYHVFSNCIVPYKGKTSETDFIVVGPSGVSIVEVKNHSDSFTGYYGDEKLTRLRNKSRKLGAEPKRELVENPIRQVAVHADRLTGFLRVNGISRRVRTFVFYVNPHCGLFLKHNVPSTRYDETRVFRQAERVELIRELKESASDTELTPETLDKVVKLLDVILKDRDLLPASELKDSFTKEKVQRAAAKYDLPLGAQQAAKRPAVNRVQAAKAEAAAVPAAKPVQPAQPVQQAQPVAPAQPNSAVDSAPTQQPKAAPQPAAAQAPAASRTRAGRRAERNPSMEELRKRTWFNIPQRDVYPQGDVYWQPGDTSLWVLRCFQTEYDQQQRLIGTEDVLLDQEGWEQAEAFGKSVQDVYVDVVAVSPLLRADQTANCFLFEHSEPVEKIVVPEFSERSLGVLQGLTPEEVQQRYPEYSELDCLTCTDTAPAGGETVRACDARVAAGLEKLLEEYSGKEILVVCHDFVAKCIHRQIMGLSFEEMHSFSLNNGEEAHYLFPAGRKR